MMNALCAFPFLIAAGLLEPEPVWLNTPASRGPAVPAATLPFAPRAFAQNVAVMNVLFQEKKIDEELQDPWPHDDKAPGAGRAGVVQDDVRNPAIEPSIFASGPMGVVFLVVGAVGWVALGLAVFFLERRSPAT